MAFRLGEVQPDGLLGVDVDLGLGLLLLQVPEVLLESLQDLRALEDLDRLDALPVRVVPSYSRDDLVEEVVGGADVVLREVVVDDVVHGTSKDGPSVVLIKRLLQSIFDRGRLRCVSFHYFN